MGKDDPVVRAPALGSEVLGSSHFVMLDKSPRAISVRFLVGLSKVPRCLAPIGSSQ